jgi:DNA-binding PadR family transcriptional regulator
MSAHHRVTPLGLAVLELLHSGPMHPYEMHQTMRTRHTDRIVKLKAGSLYHAVERLERLGLVQVAETSRAGRRPERTVYALTEAGEKAFAEQVADLLAVPAEEFPAYTLAVGLSPSLDRATVLGELRRREDEVTRQVAADRAAVERLERMELPARYWLDVRLTLAMREAELAWTTDLIAQIDSGRLDWPTTREEPTTGTTDDTTSGDTTSGEGTTGDATSGERARTEPACDTTCEGNPR